MNRFVLAVAASAGVFVGALRALDDEAPFEEVYVKEVQAHGQAWQFAGVRLPEGYTATVTATGTWGINATWEKKVGAGGNPEYTAAEGYVKPGAHEGCLLVRVGDAVTAFDTDDQKVRLDAPGRVYLCANDVPTEAGLKRAALFVRGIPVPAAKSAGGDGFQDNTGALTVKVVVRKAPEKK